MEEITPNSGDNDSLLEYSALLRGITRNCNEICRNSLVVWVTNCNYIVVSPPPTSLANDVAKSLIQALTSIDIANEMGTKKLGFNTVANICDLCLHTKIMKYVTFSLCRYVTVKFNNYYNDEHATCYRCVGAE